MPEASPQLVTIPAPQRRLHIVSEWAALLVAVPALTWIATNPEVPRSARTVAGGLAVATLIIDGALLLRWYGGCR